jgi:hypothetical protein
MPVSDFIGGVTPKKKAGEEKKKFVPSLGGASGEE